MTMSMTLALQRRILWIGISVGTLAGLALWYALLRLLPDGAKLQPLQTAIACVSIAGLLTLLPGIEAIAHERLVTAAIDPLTGIETRRMRVNARYLTNTLEQFVVFAVGLVGLASYTSPKVLTVATIVWILARWAFWIGYHWSSLGRAIGAPAMAQNLLVLLYVGYRFGTDAYGRAGGLGIVAVFVIIELFLFWTVLRKQ